MIVKHCIRNLANEPFRQRVILRVLDVFNCCSSDYSIGHACRQEPVTGKLCCDCEATARKKCEEAILNLLLFVPPTVPVPTRWLSRTAAFGFWLLGCLVCKLVPKGYLAAWSNSAALLEINDLGVYTEVTADADSLQELADDEAAEARRALFSQSTLRAEACHQLHGATVTFAFDGISVRGVQAGRNRFE